ncbi:Uncharacterised protein [Burkholderia pseudomallei]|nr:Uncharacterised protein [Burkholderia pseudomallei]
MPPAIPTTRSWISFFGLSGWLDANAGHAASHLPHCTHASKLSNWFQRNSAGFATPYASRSTSDGFSAVGGVAPPSPVYASRVAAKRS